MVRKEARAGRLWAGLYRLAVELGYRWDGGRWIPPGGDGCGVACGAGAGLGSGAPDPAPSRTSTVPVSHGAPKRVTSSCVAEPKRGPQPNLLSSKTGGGAPSFEP